MSMCFAIFLACFFATRSIPLFTMVNVLGNCTATCILDKQLQSPAVEEGSATPSP